MSTKTKSAVAYVGHLRRDDRAATWFDVAEAYDAGLRHGLAYPKSAIKQLEDAGYMVHSNVKRRVGRIPQDASSQGESVE